MPPRARTPRPDTVTLVADDFALTPGVSESILELAGAARLSGTGAMTNRPHWAIYAPRLDAVSDGLEVGLHFNLTLGQPLGAMPHLASGGDLPRFGALAGLAFSGKLDGDEIEAEAVRQIRAFADRLGRLPDFIDGHQHVHVLPVVRAALLRAVEAEFGQERPWLRDPFDTPGSILVRGVAAQKAFVIAALATGWRRALSRRGLEHNVGFAGVSPFDPRRDFAEDFARFLRAPGPRHLVMCHPGFADAELASLDPVVATRPLEHDFLAGNAFPETLAEAGLALERRRAP